MNAYDRIYLDKARTSLGRMLDYAVHDLKCDITTIWEYYTNSPISWQFENGAVSVLAGRSGVELALEVLGIEKDYVKPFFSEGRSEEYWVGWALAYYQWNTGIRLSQLTKYVPIDEILRLYTPYHEMDIRQFCDRLTEIYNKRKHMTNLKQRRLESGLSQSQLAELTGIPVRTLQQYDQGQKSINKAGAEYVLSLARALCCAPEILLET